MLVRVSTLQEGRTPGWQGIDRPSPTVTASGAAKGQGHGATEIQVLVEPWEDAVKIRAQAGGNLRRIDDVTDRPMSSVMAFQPTDVYLEEDAFAPARPARRDAKPPYRVPTMAEIAKTRKNGRVVASTFSGAGGSCLGYRMAGYDVRAAVEIAAVPAETYRRNFPGSAVLEKSIRDVTAAEILEACDVGPGELDLFDGSPPCTSFSTAGLRAKTWGQEREHAGTTQRIDDLFLDYARLVDELQPRVFVAENVRGLGQGAAIGYFKAILRALRACGYVVAAQLLDADLLGVPQHRERIFFVGVRQDVADLLGLDTEKLHDLFPKPLDYQYTVRDALPWLDPSSSAYNLQGTPFGDPERIAAGKATPTERVKPADAAPAATIHGSPKAGVQLVHDTGGTMWDGEPNRRDVPLDGPVPTISSGQNGRNSDHYQVQVVHDTGRKGRDPRDVLDEVAPTIVNGTDDPAAGGGSRQHWKVVETSDGGTVYRRKFTILELKRLCSFPDDVELVGKFAEQWAQCGNSVPPLMMRAVAEAVHAGVFAPLDALEGKKPRRRRATREKRAGGAR